MSKRVGFNFIYGLILSLIYLLSFRINISLQLFSFVILITYLHESTGLILKSLSFLMRVFIYSVFLAKCWSGYIGNTIFDNSFFFHLSLPNIVYARAYPLQLFLSFFLIFAFLIQEIMNQKKERLTSRRSRWMLLPVFLLSLGFSNSFELIKNFKSNFDYIEKPPVAIQIINQTLQEKGIDLDRYLNKNIEVTSKQKKNLVVLYLESVEKKYFDQDKFPDLLPFLTKIKQESFTFENFAQVKGGSFTTGGLFLTQCGNSIEIVRKKRFWNDVLSFEPTSAFVCLGDVFKLLGYNQTFIQGGDLGFAGTGRVFKEHGFNKVVGIESFQKNERHHWGSYDQYLFRDLKKEFKALDEKGDPFVLVSLNIDTHDPGYLSPKCPRYEYSEDKIVRSVHCLDYLIQDFLEAIRSTHSYNDTLFVFVSDHLSMTKFRGEKGRKLVFFILDGGQKNSRVIHRRVTQYDFPNIILSKLGVEGNFYFPFGRIKVDAKLTKTLQDYYQYYKSLRVRPSSKVIFSHAQKELTIDGEVIGFSHDDGKTEWPDSFIGVIGISEQGRILSSSLIRKNQLFNVLENNSIHDVLLLGKSSDTFQYYWGNKNHALKKTFPMAEDELTIMKYYKGS